MQDQDQSPRVVQLLEEIRDIQREHLEAYRAFTGRISATTEQQRDDARRVQEQALQDQRETNRKNTLVIRVGVGALCLILAGGMLGIALVMF